MNYIFLHGFCSGPGSRKGQYLKRQFQQRGVELMIPDLNGGNFTHMTISSQLEIIEATCNQFTGPITLLGSSMGALLAVLYAEKSLQVKTLVMIAPAFKFAERRLREISPEIMTIWREKGSIPVYHHGYEKELPLHYGIIEDAIAFDQEPLNRQLPALLIHGMQDESVPYQLSIDYLQLHPQAVLHLLNGDHSLTREDQLKVIWQQTDLFLEMSNKEFLDP